MPPDQCQPTMGTDSWLTLQKLLSNSTSCARFMGGQTNWNFEVWNRERFLGGEGINQEHGRLKFVADPSCWLVASKITQRQNTRHTRDRQYTLRPEGQNCAKLIAVYYYKRPLGRIPGCMNKPFQYRAGAYMLSYSKGEWNPCLLQSLSKALFSFFSQEGNALSFARDHYTQGCVQTLWQNASFARTFSPSRETRLQAHLCYPINPSSPPFLFYLSPRDICIDVL